MRFKLAGVLLSVCMAVGVSCAQASETIKADFENYTEGTFFKPSFLDSRSGIFFANSTASSQNFAIEYADNPSQTQPFFLNNKYLVSNGFAPGSGASLAGSFGFTGTLPAPANHISIDVGVVPFSPACSVSMTGYDVGERIVDSDAFTLPSANSFTQRSLQVDSDQFDMVRFVLSVNQCSTGYDNIIAVTVPEPSSMILLLGGGMLLRRRPGQGRWMEMRKR